MCHQIWSQLHINELISETSRPTYLGVSEGADVLAGWLASLLACWLTGWFAYLLACWLAGLLACYLAGLLARMCGYAYVCVPVCVCARTRAACVISSIYSVQHPP